MSKPPTTARPTPVSWLRQRLLAPRLPASIAELMLLNRLRARTRSDLALDSLERATQVIDVTCKDWFAHEGAALARLFVSMQRNDHRTRNRPLVCTTVVNQPRQD